MKSYMKKVLAGALVLGMAGNVSAAPMVYDNDKPGWEAAVGAHTTEAFGDAILNPGVSVSSENGVVDTTKEVWWDRLDGSTTEWTFEGGSMGFGGDWDLANVNGPGTGIIVAVINGAEVEVGEIDNDNIGEFWGFVSDTPFTSVLLKNATQSSGVETYEMDNMVYSDQTVSLDVHPQGCPNPINLKSKGVTPMAILGSDTLDVNDINIETLRINGVSPVGHAYEDVATPYEGGFSETADKYECNEDEGDGYMDLTLKFNTQELGLTAGEQFLTITGERNNGMAITGKDVVWVK